jgi:acyl-[acyl-carrier-protein]-phospholipid O-acyltransferase/long-chain-fatty-acid--[acyl-carrier-protein] ligase
MMLLAAANFLTSIYICKILPNTVLRNVVRTILIMIYRIEVSGHENLQKAGRRVMIISNHNSSLDPLIISAFLSGKLYFAMDDYLIKSAWLFPFMKLLKAVPVSNSHPMSAKTLIDKLKAGEQVVVFPEGRITVTGSLMKIYDLPGTIADKADATLLPIRIEGSQYSMFSRVQGKLKIKLFPKIKMSILPPRKIEVRDSELSSSRERRHVIGDKLYDIMSETMFFNTQAEQTLFEALLGARKQFGGRHIIASDINKVTLSYNKLIIGAFALGHQIAQKTRFGEKVGVLLPNMNGTLVTFFAILVYGRIPAMLNFSTGIKSMLSCCHAAQIVNAYTSRLFVETADINHIIDALESNGISVRFMEDERQEISVINKVAAMFKACFAHKFYWEYALDQGVTAKSPAVVIFTSGSEGKPKGVALSHLNVISNLKQATARIDIRPSDRVFNALPMFHSFGLAAVVMPLLCGASTFLYPSPLHYRVVPEMIYAHNSTVFFATDTFLAGYAKYAHPYDFFSVRYVFAGAEKLRAETRRVWIERFGIRIFEAYGTTEASPIICANTPMHCKHGTVGRILPNIDWLIEKVPGVQNGGKLIIRGPNVMLGYLKDDNPGVIQAPEHYVNGALQKGWYDTGDVVTIDEEKYITIVGRMKRFAKVGGEMISLAAVEEVINQLWPDFTNAVITIADLKKSEVICLITEKLDASRDELIKFFHKSGYADLFCPKRVITTEQIPVLSTGKVDYVSVEAFATTYLDK